MNNESLEEILAYWSYWDTSPPPSVPRVVRMPALDPQLVLAIQGVRRCGKSTLLGQMLERFKLPPRQCVFANFEDPRLVPHLGPDLLFQIVELMRSRRPGEEHLWLFFDEVQSLPGWESWLHTRLERSQSEHYVVSGSNASLLSGELSSRLTGRHRLVELFPFDFQEAERACSGLSVEKYLDHGGFPKIVTGGGDLELRQQYFRDIVERDISNRVGARASAPVMAVILMAFESCGAEMSLRRLAAACQVSVDTASIYLRAAEDAYLLFACPFFSHSTRQQQVRNKKYYPVDPGLRRAVVASSARDLGKALESTAYLALKQRFGRVCYWRHHREVDFVVIREGRPWPIQVTWGEPQERHHAALDEFYAAFPQAREALFLGPEDLRENFARLAL